MLSKRRPLVGLAVTIATVAVLAGTFYQRAAYNLQHIDYRNSNFVFFWLAGRMVLSGENPYDSVQWLAQHDANNVTWRPNSIFPYPLPLAYFLAPLGLLALDTAYFWWQMLSLASIATVVWLLLRRSSDSRLAYLVAPIVLVLLYFGPVYLTLQIGALSAFTMLALAGAILAADQGMEFVEGLLVSLSLLKPPQGLPIIALACVWWLSRRNWKPVTGVMAGAAALFVIGVIGDPHWPSKFLAAGQTVLNRTLGLQSNVFGLAYLVCARNEACMWWLGGGAAIAAFCVTGVFLYRRGESLTAWDAFSLIGPVAFLSTPYLWSYDQILYIIPIVWIISTLLLKRRGYIIALLFLTVLVAASFVALAIHANTHSDVWSAVSTLLVLAGLLALLPGRSIPRKATAAN